MAKKIIAWLLVVVLTAGAAIGGTLAYLTDRDSEANVFTVGDVDITLDEEFQQGSQLVPGADIEKNVQIKNEGPNAAWVWYTYAVPQGLEAGLDLTFDNTDKWTNEATAIGTKEVDGVIYNVYVSKYKTAVAAGATTGVGLTKVTMDPAVDITPEGDAYLVNAGATTSLNWNINNTENPIIFINAYAIQTEGFADVDAAYAAFAGQWGDMVNAGTYDAATEDPTEPEPVMDPRAVYNGVTYETLHEAVAAANENGGGEITMLGSYEVASTLAINTDITLKGDGNYLLRSSNFKGNMLVVSSGKTLTTEEITIDGGAVWTGEVDARLLRGTENIGVKGSDDMIRCLASASVYLGQGTVVQNHDGDCVVWFVNTNDAATNGVLTLDGAKIINNHSSNAVLMASGNVVMKAGSQISYNATDFHSTIRLNGWSRFDMYDGEVSCNRGENGGAVSVVTNNGGGQATMNLMGGKICNNEATAHGGAIYVGYAACNINLSGTEITNNTAPTCAAICTSNTYLSSLYMTGGKISGNVSTNGGQTPDVDVGKKNVSFTGGVLEDAVKMPVCDSITLGGTEGGGTFYLPNATVKLTENFGTIRFVSTRVSFRPADGYTYTEGDEAKLVCLNEGYSTYWDDATSSFRLKAN